MSMKTMASIFTGGDGWGQGAMQAGYEPIWGVEIDPAIADVARANGCANVMARDVRKVNVKRLDRPDVLVASPPCTDFSVAGKQGFSDDLTNEVIRFVRVLRPRVVMVENVIPWRLSEVYARLLFDLCSLGYWVTIDRLYCPDFGVPQTRRRLIVRACRDGLLRPLTRQPFVSWHDATSDLLEGLEGSDFAPWQMAKGLPDCLDTRFLVSGQNSRQCNEVVWRWQDEPGFTVTSSSKGPCRIWTGERVVKSSPRFNARLQTFDDSYQLPASATLANRVIGNAVPPKLSRILFEAIDD